MYYMEKNKNEDELPILDSRLISPTLIKDVPKIYNIKIVDCGSYQQVYYYEKIRLKNRKRRK